MMKEGLRKLNGHSRREFMKNVAKSTLGVSMASTLGGNRVYGATGGGKAEHCIFL